MEMLVRSMHAVIVNAVIGLSLHSMLVTDALEEMCGEWAESGRGSLSTTNRHHTHHQQTEMKSMKGAEFRRMGGIGWDPMVSLMLIGLIVQLSS